MGKIEFFGLGAFLEGTLIISDLHIGYEESLAKAGVLIPRFQLNDLRIYISSMIRKFRPGRIVVAGDFKHEFGEISRQEWMDAKEILDLLSLSSEVILVRGNHDNILGPLAAKSSLNVVERYQIGETLILHGHQLAGLPQGVRRIIIGHQHPAVSLREGRREETFKCFLAGHYKDHELIVLPSMNSVVPGSDVLKEEIISPFIEDLDNMEVYITDEDTLYFGSVRKLKGNATSKKDM